MEKLLRTLMFSLIFGLIFYFAFAAPNDPDFGSHLRYGEYILKEKMIPKVDFLTHTYYGKAYGAFEWLSEVLIFSIFQKFSFWGLVILSTSITSVSFYFLIKHFSNPLYKILSIVFAGLISNPILIGGSRPQLMTVLGTSFLIFSLVKLDKGIKKYALFLPLIFLLWGNTHGSFIVGLAIVGFYWFDKLVGIMLKREVEVEFSFITLISLSSGVASALNFSLFPLLRGFLNLSSYVFLPASSLGQQTGASLAKTTILEWLPPFFLAPPGFTYIIFVLITAVVFIFCLNKFSPWEVITIVLFSYMAGVSRRHMAFFAFSVCPLVLLKIEKELDLEKLTHLISSRTSIVILLIGSLFLGAGIYQKSFWVLHLIKSDIDYFRLNSYPYQAADYLHTHPQKGNMFNYYNWGGFLNWRLPESKVFIDGRIPGSQPFLDYLKIWTMEEGWYEILEKYNVSWVIMPGHSKLVKTLKEEKGWKEVYKDVLTSVVVKP